MAVAGPPTLPSIPCNSALPDTRRQPQPCCHHAITGSRISHPVCHCNDDDGGGGGGGGGGGAAVAFNNSCGGSGGGGGGWLPMLVAIDQALMAPSLFGRRHPSLFDGGPISRRRAPEPPSPVAVWGEGEGEGHVPHRPRLGVGRVRSKRPGYGRRGEGNSQMV